MTATLLMLMVVIVGLVVFLLFFVDDWRLMVATCVYIGVVVVSFGRAFATWMTQ